MHLSLTQALLVALLASNSLAAPIAGSAEVGQFAPELTARHHTEAQIAAKEKAEKKKHHHENRDVPAPDEFGPWDSTEDEFGSWVTPRDVEAREAHHTEAQIAAKEKAEKKKHHHETREAHHTEAQIAAKEKAEKKKKHHENRDVPAPDEFGPWDSTEDEFGSWVTPRDVEAREAHHTEAQIAAKEKAEKKKHHHENREAHHTEAQIAAKEKAEGEKKKKHHD